MTQHYDPCYLRSTTREFGPGDGRQPLRARFAASPSALAATARTLVASRATRPPAS